MNQVKRVYRRLILIPRLASSVRFAQRDCATVFMFHRFGDPGSKGDRHDPARLRRALEYLRRNDYELISVVELFQRLSGNGPRLRGAVAFTLDDGYLDQAEIAAPIFREFDCPVTAFVTTGFLDGELWMWWDKVEYVFSHTRRESFEVAVDGAAIRYELTSELRARTACADFIERRKYLDADERHEAVADLARNAEVDLPQAAPAMYAPMTWEHLRSCERQGMTFGPHSVSHPILSRVSKERAAWEITESWNRLRAEAKHPVPVFCYPNGLEADFGAREIGIIREAGLLGALTAESGFADASAHRRSSDEAFRVKRFDFPEDLSVLLQYVSGLERIKEKVRGSLA